MILAATLRQAVVDEASSWIGTPFQHQQCLKGVGVDCCTILSAVYGRVCGVSIELPYYDVQWNLHDDTQTYLAEILRHCVEISPWRNHEPVPEGYSLSPDARGFGLDKWDACPPLPGDIGLWWFGRKWAHVTIVLDWPVVLNPMMGGTVAPEAAQTIGSISERFMRMRLMRPKVFVA